jgi:hypothetical protein
MPLSPLTRLLIVLTLLAFPWVFVSMIELDSWLAPGLLGVSLSLWTAALFGIVKSSAAFDERGFHPTRPGGRSRTFRRSTWVILSMITIISLMAAVRGACYNLGWRAIWTGTLITFALLSIFTAALATGFNLSFNQARANRWVGWIMVGLPMAVHLAVVEARNSNPWPGGRMFESWTMNLSAGVILATAAYGVAWWLASRRGCWWPGLIACGVAGVSLAVPAIQKPLLGREPAEPPQASVTIGRLPVTNPEKSIQGPNSEVCRLELADYLTVNGLRDDEVLQAYGTFPLPGKSLRSWHMLSDSRYGGGFRLVRWNATDSDDPRLQNRGHLLASRLASAPEAKSAYSEFSHPVHFYRNESGAILSGLNRSDWKLSGSIRRVVHEVSFPLAVGGSQPLKHHGHLKVWPATRTALSLIIKYRLIVPGRLFDPDRKLSIENGGHQLDDSMVLLVSRSGTFAAFADSNDVVPRRVGLASEWTNRSARVSLADLSKWYESEIEGATIHIFTTHPAAAVDMTLAPPER